VESARSPDVAGRRDTEVAVLALADGAGSVRYGDLGAQIACDTFIACAGAWARPVACLNAAVIGSWIQSIRLRLEQSARLYGARPADFGCTLLGALLTPASVRLCQIGDGAWVASTNTGWEPATWPVNGEFANVTTFVTCPDWRDAFQFRSLDTPLHALIGCTDGVQHLLLDRRAHGVREAVAEKLVSPLQKPLDAGARIRLESDLRRFLSAGPAAGVSSDDKTLVLAARAQTARAIVPTAVRDWKEAA
jgi:hypothetical protein